jgi:hypothetical protein
VTPAARVAEFPLDGLTPDVIDSVIGWAGLPVVVTVTVKPPMPSTFGPTTLTDMSVTLNGVGLGVVLVGVGVGFGLVVVGLGAGVVVAGAGGLPGAGADVPGAGAGVGEAAGVAEGLAESAGGWLGSPLGSALGDPLGSPPGTAAGESGFLGSAEFELELAA